jgi:hypothetical protein
MSVGSREAELPPRLWFDTPPRAKKLTADPLARSLS